MLVGELRLTTGGGRSKGAAVGLEAGREAGSGMVISSSSISLSSRLFEKRGRGRFLNGSRNGRFDSSARGFGGVTVAGESLDSSKVSSEVRKTRFVNDLRGTKRPPRASASGVFGAEFGVGLASVPEEGGAGFQAHRGARGFGRFVRLFGWFSGEEFGERVGETGFCVGGFVCGRIGGVVGLGLGGAAPAGNQEEDRDQASRQVARTNEWDSY